jgi:membrane protease YdiL (CAAX protease family)
MSNSNSPHNSITFDFWWSLSTLLFTIFTALFLSNILALALVLPMLDFSLPTLEAFIENPLAYPQHKMAMLQMQGIASVFTFIAAPLLYIKYLDKPSVAVNIDPNKEINPLLWILTALTIICFMPADSWVISWNQSVELPEFFAGIESWAKEQEKANQGLMLYLTNFSNPVEFLAGLVILALVPAIGEELLFRGILQSKIAIVTKNYHIGIWIAAIVFSAIHFQFYGFVPRMLLGALFGYMYVWSGNLAIPILAHFVNNGFTLLLIYAGLNLEATAPTEMALLSALLVILFIYLFRRVALNKT